MVISGNSLYACRNTFKNCYSLTSDIQYIFCYDDKDIVSTFISMFENCSSITTIKQFGCGGIYDISSFTCYRTFYNCKSLSTIKNFDISNGTIQSLACYQTFMNCDSLTSFKLNYENITYLSESLTQFLNSCSSLTLISTNLPYWWVDSKQNLVTKNWLSGCSLTGNFYYPENFQSQINKGLKPEFGDSFIPENWLVNDKLAYLTFTALEDNTKISLNSYNGTSDVKFKYKKNINKFEQYNPNTIIELSANETLSFINGNNVLNTSDNSYYQFNITGQVFADGNIYSLINYNCTEEQGIINFSKELPSYCFTRLFENCSGLITAPTLDREKLSIGCYKNMFNGCYNLTSQINLPADTIYKSSYESMFKNCSSLLSVYFIHDLNLYGQSCCQSMFENCYKLNTVNNMNFTICNRSAGNTCKNTFKNCYSLTSQVKALGWTATGATLSAFISMFENCSSITTINSINVHGGAAQCSFASTFMNCFNLSTIKYPVYIRQAASYACQKMFYNCTSLSSIIIDTKTEHLGIQYIDTNSLKQMFYGCSSLAMISTNLKSWYDSSTTEKELVSENWVSGVSSHGDFYYSSNQLDTTKRGESYIPDGWTPYKIN